ncbi:unnamed protein product [Rotaria sordida]|uniref:Uncharacterized protein n=1 Tax=Rotaria sordida TaxID=392033 RepID=A0A815N7W3_9BILA|nr:unnamed protein product [Rotaria sordida]CAF1631256.1 unnamed protein product [Rotaria sordida]
MPPLTDPNAPPATVGDKLKQNFSMFIEISKNRPISGTLCLKEASIISLPILSMGRFTQRRATKYHEQLAELERQLDEIISKQQTERN